MHFTYEEKLATLYVASAIAASDGDMVKDESLFRGKVAIFLGLSNDDNMALQSMKLETACQIIRDMSTENKRFTAAVMTYMKYVDGYVRSEETHAIQLISTVSTLPAVDKEEAYNLLKSLGIIGSKMELIWGTLRHGC